MIFMMGILYGVVWGGLYKAVGIATESEKRKSEPEGLNKVPKRKAKPPKKPKPMQQLVSKSFPRRSIARKEKLIFSVITMVFAIYFLIKISLTL